MGSTQHLLRWWLAAALRVSLAALVLPSAIEAQTLRYQAVWHSGSGSNIVTGPLALAAFLDKGEELTSQGLRLIDVETARVGGRRVYTGLWVSGSGGNLFVGPTRPEKFRQLRQEKRSQGLRLVDFEVIGKGEERRLVGVWRPGSGRERINKPLSASDFIELGEELTAKGLRLIDVEVERAGGDLRYTGLWREGSGSNLFTTPRRPRAFRKLRDEMQEKGLELVDFERVQQGGSQRFVGVWSSGSGESRLSVPREFDDFVAFGEDQTAAGLRTQDHEIFRGQAEPEPPPPDGGTPDDGPSGGGPSASDLPEPPSWIELSGSTRLIVDFGHLIEGNPRVTLPVDFLPDFLPESDGEPVIPDNFCGFNIRKADSFFWHTQDNEVVTDFPYNAVENVADLGDNEFLGGISLTGPMGQCLEDNEPWQFFQPLTQTGGDSPIPGLKLIVEMRSESEIEFLNFNIHPEEGLSAHELFSDEVFEQLKAIAEAFESLEVDNGYCSIDNYVQKICEEEEEGEAPEGSCPVGDDFSSPC